MYKELGGRIGYLRTPIRELQEIRISIIAELNVQTEKEAELKQKQEEQEREMEQQKRRLNRG